MPDSGECDKPGSFASAFYGLRIRIFSILQRAYAAVGVWLANAAKNQGSCGSDFSGYYDKLQDYPAFRNSPRLIALLRYILKEELEGRGDRIKAYSIALDVYGKPIDFDPQKDSCVRVDMLRLRRTIDEFHRDNPEVFQRVKFQQGSYRPEVHFVV